MSVIPPEPDERHAASARARAWLARLAVAATLGGALPVVTAAQRVPPARDPAAERAALQQLDASLAEVSAELARVGERAGAARAAVRPEAAAPLVVLLRVDPGSAPALASATAGLDDGAGVLRRYEARERDALRAGAADELLRTTLGPGTHAVRATVSAAGGTATRTATVTAPANGRVTYLEFTLRDGSLDAAAWVADAPTAAGR